MKKLSHPFAYDTKPRFTEEHKKYGHGHLYYLVAVVSLALFIFCAVQGILVQAFMTDIQSVNYTLGFALLSYIIAVLFLAIAIASYNRGKGHYPYPWHK